MKITTPYFNYKFPRKIDNLKKQNKKINKFSKLKILFLVLGFCLLVIALFIFFYQTTVWYRKHDIIFRSPIKIELFSPITVIEKKTVVETVLVPVPEDRSTKTEYDIVMSYKRGEILWKIYQLESQRGKNDTCRANNLGYGGFGVMVNKKVVCYDTFDKAVERAEYWLIENGIDKNLVDTLCVWNLGFQRDADGKHIPYINCKYYQSYLSVK